MLRPLAHCTTRRISRRSLAGHTTRVLGGGRRPHEPNYFNIAFRALEQYLRLQQLLRPCFEEEQRRHEQFIEDEKWDEAIRKAYGDVPGRKTMHQHREEHRRQLGPKAYRQKMAEIRKDQKVLAKSQLIINSLSAKLHKPY
jgi:hypothetical protein